MQHQGINTIGRDWQPTERHLWYALWSVTVAIMAGYCFVNYRPTLQGAEELLLFVGTAGLIGLGWRWRTVCALSSVVAGLSLLAILLYGQALERAESHFVLKYFLSSQSAITWMSVCYLLSFLGYLMYLARHSEFSGRTARAFCWTGVTMGLTGMLVRWRESWLLGADIGHIPVSNLYEVFVLFTIITSLIYLYYEQRYRAYGMGAFVMLIVSLAVCFLFWYAWTRDADQIQPLVPALQSYWMKIHVPANFIGYGCFSIAAMLGAACLLRDRLERRSSGAALLAPLPTMELLHDVMYRAIALGFVFFSLATILGSLWAAEAWGGYWSWDPKETWALIVWLNYAAWLHMHMSRGWHGNVMAWWSVIGLFITLFAFLGVNLFLSGLHSYGEL